MVTRRFDLGLGLADLERQQLLRSSHWRVSLLNSPNGPLITPKIRQQQQQQQQQQQKQPWKQPSKWQQDVKNQAGVEQGVGRVEPSTTSAVGEGGGGVKLDEVKIRAKGKI